MITVYTVDGGAGIGAVDEAVKTKKVKRSDFFQGMAKRAPQGPQSTPEAETM